MPMISSREILMINTKTHLELIQTPSPNFKKRSFSNYFQLILGFKKHPKVYQESFVAVRSGQMKFLSSHHSKTTKIDNLTSDSGLFYKKIHHH